MFVSDKLIFIELQKTGCTHIRNLLQELVGGELVGKHNQADAQLVREPRRFLGSVRDPWDWYISLWAYGCDRRGAFYANVTRDGLKFRGQGWKDNPLAALRQILTQRANRHAQQWQRSYRDAGDAGAFREWLHMVHDPEYWSDFGEGYGQWPANRVAGLFTYRYLKLFCCDSRSLSGLHGLSGFEQLTAFERKHCFIDHFIRNENLEADLFLALERTGLPVADRIRSEILRRSRTNTSSRSKGPAHYYDDRSEALVAQRDRLIVEKFGYLAPSLRDGGQASVQEGIDGREAGHDAAPARGTARENAC